MILGAANIERLAVHISLILDSTGTSSSSAGSEILSYSLPPLPSFRPGLPPTDSQLLVDDEEPLYDSVASEDDYSTLERRNKIITQQKILTNNNDTTAVSMMARLWVPTKSFKSAD